MLSCATPFPPFSSHFPSIFSLSTLFSFLRPFLYYLICLFTSLLFIHVTSHFSLEMGLIYILFSLSLSLSLFPSPLSSISFSPSADSRRKHNIWTSGKHVNFWIKEGKEQGGDIGYGGAISHLHCLHVLYRDWLMKCVMVFGFLPWHNLVVVVVFIFFPTLWVFASGLEVRLKNFHILDLDEELLAYWFQNFP